jgi:hypothetical protein
MYVFRFKVGAAALAASVLFGVSTAQAVTITNNDEKEYTITVLEGDKERQVILKPDQRLEGVCPEGCRIRLPDDDEDYEVEGKDSVIIEDGQLFYDDPATPEPAPGQQPPAGAPPANKG